MLHIGVVGKDTIATEPEIEAVQEEPQGYVKWSVDDVI